VNCFSIIEKNATSLYCSEVCAQAAEWVRYVRRCRLDGRLAEPDIKNAIQIRLAFVLGGGYPKLERALPEATRRAVFERDRGTCQVCGAPGTEIDHKSGSSNALENLQLLCDSCHNNKTVSTFVRITKESHPEASEKAKALRRRAGAQRPLQLCDAEEWLEIQNDLLRRRRTAATGQQDLFDT
jgi:5-methylcytosine-specific restriction endonuclease McrA